MVQILKSFITSFENDIDLNQKINLVGNDYIRFEIDGKVIKGKQNLFELFIKTINGPDYFGYNWAAFWDIIRDQEYRITKKLVIIIKDKNDLLGDEYQLNSKDIFFSILTDLLDMDGYYIFIQK